MGWILLSALLLGGPPAAAPSILGGSVDGRVEDYGGVYCGIYCLQAALAAQGLPLPPMESLQDRKYVSSFFGSSTADLVRAARDLGHQLHVFTGLSLGTLRLAEGPIILHVRKEGFGNPYSHWMLFLGMDGEKARILDPPMGLELWDVGDVAAVWNGVGLTFQAPSVGWIGAFGLDVGTHVLLTMTVLCLVLSARHLLSGAWVKSPVSRTFLDTAVLVLVAVILSATCHFAMPEGFGRCPTGLSLVRASYFPAAFPTVSTDEVQALLRNAEARVVLVDARFPAAFSRGHLPGAVNLPVSTHLQTLKRTLQLDRAATLIVYCESEGCGWSDVIAHKLQILGARDVRVYRRGYQGWPIQEDKP
jgi:rhodanese-related sulfurtransferase